MQKWFMQHKKFCKLLATISNILAKLSWKILTENNWIRIKSPQLFHQNRIVMVVRSHKKLNIRKKFNPLLVRVVVTKNFRVFLKNIRIDRPMFLFCNFLLNLAFFFQTRNK